jgi:5-methylcytosine-specific restriction endonuclease McrA
MHFNFSIYLYYMEKLKCKVCKIKVPIENYSLRLSNGKYIRYGKTCDECRKKINKQKTTTDEFRKKNRIKQNKYNHKRFFYSRATSMINRIKRCGENVPYTPMELAKYLAILWKKQNGECMLSGDKLTRENAHVDHIITKNNGGSNDFDNLRWLTKISNGIKNSLNDDELIEHIKKIYNKLVINSLN